MAAKTIDELSSGTISGSALLFNGNPSGGALTKNTFDDLAEFIGVVPTYAAVINQTSTEAPTVVVAAYNTLGETITFSYVSAGVYRATASGSIFSNGKTLVTICNGNDSDVGAARTSATVIEITAASDGAISLCSFKIEIYP